MTHDFLIVGAGLTGATLARQLTDAGHSCLVIDKREHVAGNCHTELRNGILVHAYGPHYFHTNNTKVWDWVQRFARWRTYTPRVKAYAKGQVFSLPINLSTMAQLWGVSSPTQAREMLESKRLDTSGADAESYLLRTVGREIYETFFYGYTYKQWGRQPSELPSSVVSRLPLRCTYDDNYHAATYQGLPENGYTEFVTSVLDSIRVELGVDYFKIGSRLAKHTIYTGPLDALYGYDLGELEYRSLRFEHEFLSIADYQGCAQMNYPDLDVPFTRVLEHRHIHGGQSSGTWVTREYPSLEGDPYYPVQSSMNRALAQRYRARAKADGILVAGRLGTYKYLDMDGAIAAALQLAEKLNA